MLKLRARHNKHQAVWLVEPGVKVGRSASNDLILDLPSIAALHFVIGVRGDRLVMKNRTSPAGALAVNGAPVEDKCLLKEGDVIALGELELEVVDPKKDSAHSAIVQTSEWSLKANNAALGNRVFPLGPSTLVGRAKDCDIHLAVAHLSRRHAQLQILDGLLYVKDLGSSNGTFLNGQKVTEARVRRGDELRFDTLSFGVLGPADDLGKTTVRSVTPTPTPISRSPRSEKSPVPEVARRDTPSPTRRAAQAPLADVGLSESSTSHRGWVGGLILLAMAGVALTVWLIRN